MSQGKGSTRRPSFIPKAEWDARYAETFAERERREANDPKEHARRLRASKARDILDGSVSAITNNVDK